MISGSLATRQHAPACPKLYGQGCTCDGYHTFEERMRPLDDILSYGNESYTGEDIRKRLFDAGYVVVPREPTEAMLESYEDKDRWGAMIAAFYVSGGGL